MKTHNPLKFTAMVTVALGMFIAGMSASAADAPKAEQPERMAVLFYADWCGSCKVLEPKVKEARAELKADAKTLFVTFDLTDEATRAQSAMLADALGLGSIYEANSKKTGFMLVIDAEDNSIQQKLTKTDEVKTIRTKLAGS